MFSETVAAHLDGRAINAALLCHMRFRDSPRRWWPGFGPLDAGGHQWLGMGEWISIDGLQAATGTVAPQTTFTLSGVDPEIVEIARNGSDQVKGRRAQVFIQFFDVDPADKRVVWAPLDEPTVVWSGIMDQVRFTADGPTSRTISLTAESLWAGRNRPPFGLYTDADQRARFPGDKGLRQVASLVSKTARFPEF